MGNEFKKIDDLNTELERAIEFCTNAVVKIEDLKEQGEEYAQKEVDKVCIAVSDKINTKLEEHKEDVVKVLHEQYNSAMEIMQQYKPIVDLVVSLSSPSLDLGFLTKVANGVIDLAKQYVKPYEKAIEFVTVVAPKLERLANNSITLATMPIILKESLPKELPNLNLDKLRINVPTPSMPEVVSGSVEEIEKNAEEEGIPQGELGRKVKIKKIFSDTSELALYDTKDIPNNFTAIVFKKIYKQNTSTTTTKFPVHWTGRLDFTYAPITFLYNKNEDKWYHSNMFDYETLNLEGEKSTNKSTSIYYMEDGKWVVITKVNTVKGKRSVEYVEIPPVLITKCWDTEFKEYMVYEEVYIKS